MNSLFIPLPMTAHTDVSPRALQVFCAIGAKPSSTPFTQVSIADELELNHKTVKKAVRELREAGYLWIERTGPGKLLYHLKQGDGPHPLEYAAQHGNKRAQKALQQQLEAQAHG